MRKTGLGGGTWGYGDPRRQPGCYSSPVRVDVLVSCTHVASCISGWSSAHVSSDMCVHVHLRMSACQGIKKDHAGGCEIRERGRGPLWESPVGMEAPRLHRAAEHTGGSVERAEAPPGSQGPGSENPAANHQDTQAPEVLRTP